MEILLIYTNSERALKRDISIEVKINRCKNSGLALMSNVYCPLASLDSRNSQF